MGSASSKKCVGLKKNNITSEMSEEIDVNSNHENKDYDDEEGDEEFPESEEQYEAQVPKIQRDTPLEEILARVQEYMEALQMSQDFSERGILSKLQTISKIHTALKIKRVQELQDVCAIMKNNNILKIFSKMWKTFHQNREEFYGDVKSLKFRILRKMKLVLLQYTDKCKSLAKHFHEDVDAVSNIMSEFNFPEFEVERLQKSPIKRSVMALNLGILINIVRHWESNKQLIRQNDGLDNIMKYANSTFLLIKVRVYIMLAYCVTEEENDKITTSYGVIKYLAKILTSAASSKRHVSSKYGFSVEETLIALTKLASSDKNKGNIVEAGILTQLSQLLRDQNSSPKESYHVINCIWSLGFHAENKKKICNEPGLLDDIKRIRTESEKSGDKDITDACSSALFVIGVEELQGERATGETKKHIMISYNWDVQPVMLQLRDYLKVNGCEVWMDVDKMHESILEAMAYAVENSAIVLMAMTESYKNSNPCRTEAEYAYRRAVPILPLLLQGGYVADGWLGAIAGMKLYVDLSESGYQTKFSDVDREINAILTSRRHYQAISKINNASKSDDHKISLVDDPGMDILAAKLSCCKWTKDEVQTWYQTIDLKSIHSLPKVDGKSLEQLCKMLIRSPDSYYKILTTNVGLDIADVLTFTSALEDLTVKSTG